MTVSNRMLAIYTFVFIAGIWTLSTLGAEEKQSSIPEELTSESFQDKIVLLSIDRSNALEHKSNSVVLTEAKIVMIGNRYFIQGIGYAPEGVSYWNKGVSTGVAWENVTRYAAFSPEQFKGYETRWQDHDEE